MKKEGRLKGATKFLGPVNRGRVWGLKTLLCVVREAVCDFGVFQVPDTKRTICAEAKQPGIRWLGLKKQGN